MNKSIIEDKGIRAVSEYLSDIGYIKPYLSTNDKTPMWDGCLFVYKSKEDFTNGCFDYRVPAQVKASEYAGDEFPEHTSFSVDITDLKNYLNDGGLAFFKVLVKEKETKIYCSFLNRFLIQDILSDAREQKTKRINLQKVPDNGVDVLDNLKRINLLRNHSLLDLTTLENRSDYKFRFWIEHLSEETDPFEYVATHFVDVLFSLNGIPGEFYPKGGPVKLQLGITKNEKISIKGVKYYDSYQEVYKEDGKHYYIGCIELIVSYKDADSPSTTMHIRLGARNLDELVNELNFIQAFSHYKQFEIGTNHVDLSQFDYSTAPFHEWEQALYYWTNVKKLYNVLHLKPTFNPEELKDGDHNNLRILIHALLYNKVVSCDMGKNHLCMFNVGEQRILLYAEHIKERGFKLFDVYEHLTAVYIDEGGVYRHTPIHSLVFAQKELPSNMQLEGIVKSYKSYKKNNPFISLRANQDLLNVLNHYDQCHDEKLLKVAIGIATWLKNEKKSAIENKNMLLLNYLQTILRQKGMFNDVEKRKLYNMKTSDNMENFARYILLGDKEKARFYLSKMGEKDKEYFVKLPIYHFMNE